MSDSSKAPRLYVDHSLCIKCGNCVAAFPDHFEFTHGNEKVEAKKGADFTDVDREKMKGICPSDAIKEEGEEEKKEG